MAIPPAAIQSALVNRWDLPLMDRAYFPSLATAVGQLLELLGDRLYSVALFGSAARGEERPESDLDLIVVADFSSGGPARWIEELGSVRAVSEAIAFRQWVQSGEYHAVQLIPYRPEELTDPGPLLLDATEDAILFEDRDGTLASALSNLRGELRRRGAVRLRDSLGFRYWDLGMHDPSQGEVLS
ncbi:MAG: nucleotidyltransferase domain-containing protein [Thermoplasmata archaeon]